MSNIENIVKVVATLRMARSAVGLSQDEVVASLGMAKSTLARIETLGSEPSANTLMNLLNFYKSLGVDIDFLSGDGVTVKLTDSGLSALKDKLSMLQANKLSVAGNEPKKAGRPRKTV